MEIGEVRWEELIATIGEQETESANSIESIYKWCIEFNE
jgi:hypothetical protein